MLSEFQIDQLKEIANIGTGNATTAISKMTGKKIMISVPELIFDRIEKIPQFFGDSKQVNTAVLMRIDGDVSGVMMVLLPPKVLEEIDEKVLLEIGNIMAGASCTAFNKLLDLNILQSLPDIATDMLGSTLDAILVEMGQVSEQMLVLKVEIDLNGADDFAGQVIFMFNPKASQVILDSADKKFKNV